MKQYLLCAVALMIMAGCAETGVVDTEPATCLAEGYQDLIGGSERNAQDTLVDLFLFGDDPPEVRYVRPGEAVTMDYRPDRVNIALDLNDIVTRVYCG